MSRLARRICHSFGRKSFHPSGIVRMVLIGRASVRRISRRRSEEGQGEGGEGEVDGGPSVPIRLSTHDCRPRPTPLPPERPPPISRAVLSSEPNWYSRRPHTQERKLQGEKGGEPLRGLRPSVHPRTPSAPTSPPGNEASFACSRAVPCYLATHQEPRTPLVASSPRRPRLAHPDVPEDDQGLLRGLDAWVEGDEAGDHPHPLTDETSPTAIRP